MKRTFILVVFLVMATLSAQQSPVVERNSVLNNLYEQGRLMEQNNATATEIQANRLAIKEAWYTIDPAIAALYKPVDNGGALPEIPENLEVNGVYTPATIQRREELIQNRDWDTDKLVHAGFVDGGVDMVVDEQGTIYISFYQNEIELNGGQFDIIYIYRSTNGGASFELWKEQNITAPIRKFQLLSLDGSGDDYILGYFVTSTEAFQVVRWNATTNSTASAEVIATTVNDFSVDKNYPPSTSTMRVFAIYSKYVAGSDAYMLHSARSVAGDFGFNWEDEFNTNTITDQIDFAYARDGMIYITFLTPNNGDLCSGMNTFFNDPMSWSGYILHEGFSKETLNPRIIAARNILNNDKVIVMASQRDVGTSNHFNGVYYIRENQNDYVGPLDYTITNSDYNIIHIDGWIRDGNDVEDFQTTYIRERADASEINVNRSRRYNGIEFEQYEAVSDDDINVFNGFASAVAETADNLPCLAFAGTSASGLYGANLYFDAKTEILDTPQFTSHKIQVFPNPATTSINIQAVEPIDNIVIYNYLGQQVIVDNPGNKEAKINISQLTTGVYIVKILSNNTVQSHKIIKN